ncbi:MAG TPA: tyrosine protein kinase [Alphaproteobacteria bacterium]|nr:tyrosine protein kinase [Alphaproteobacteria bacterium]
MGGVCLAGAALAVAILRQREARAYAARVEAHRTQIDALLQRERALIDAEPGNLFVWTPGDKEPRVRAGVGDTLTKILEGDKGHELREAMQGLNAGGSMFAMTAPALDGKVFAAYGKPASGQAAIWLRDVTSDAEQAYHLEQRLAHANRDLARLTDLADASDQPMWRRSRDGQLTWVNMAYVEAVGAATPDAVIADQIELDRGTRDMADRVALKGEGLREKRYVVVAGQRRALDVSVMPVEDGYATFAVDVTEMDDLRRQLQQAAETNETTLNRLTTAVAIFGPEHRLVFANHAYAKLWGLDEGWLASGPSEGDVLERLRDMGRLPEQRDFSAWKRERLSLYTRLVDAQEELWHVDGGRTLRLTAAPHPQGGLIYIVADVTDQLTLERSYNQMTKMQSATIDALSDGVAVFGADGRLKLANQAFSQMWALPPRLMQGQPRFAEVFSACRDLLPDGGHWAWLTNLIASGNTEDRRGMHGPFERLDGMHVSFATQPLPDGSLMITVRNVTDTVAKESALQERNDALVAADQLKSEFISHVSYQLRTPLTSIAGFAEILKEGVAGKLNTKQLGYLDNVMAASATLETLINDILDLALIEAKRLELDLVETDLAHVLDGVEPLFRERAEKAKLTIEMQVAPNTGAMLADQKRLRQIIYNLVVNAIEHTPPLGRIEVKADAIGDTIRLTVADTGTGLAPEYQSKAFERFVTGSKVKGARRAGLGLALVKSFVQLHGGYITLESATGQGTTVTCYLPRQAKQNLCEPDTALDPHGIPLDALRIPAE